MAVADDLTNRLLVHSRLDPATMERRYPLSVFSWRQALAAARGEGIDATASLSSSQAARVGRQLGADALFVGSYRVVGSTVHLTWHLFRNPQASAKSKRRTLKVKLDQLNAASEQLFADILADIGQADSKIAGHGMKRLPLAAMRPFGQALRILRRQSLDPRAQLVLPRPEVERAHNLLHAATDSSPEFDRAWVERGIASTMLGNAEAAEAEFVQAMAHAGEFSPANALGLYYFYDRLGKHEESIKVLKEATEAHMGFLHGLGYLGQAYLRCNHAHEAVTVFTTYESRAPRNPWARVMRAQALARIGKHDQAVRETKDLVREFPESLLTLSALASRQIDAKQYNEARDNLERALAAHADHPLLLTRLSYIELEKGSAKTALELAQKAVARGGDGRGKSLAGYAHANLGHALALLGKRNEALAALRQAIALGMTADDRLLLMRDPRLSDFLKDPRCPIQPVVDH
jgi:tetratricopeptide (TPR) repeat protein